MGYRAEVLAIPPAMQAEMLGKSWHDDPRCPRFDELALVRVRHLGWDGGDQEGALVVASKVADDVAQIFERIYDARFPIESMVPIDAYEGSDPRSMAANNSSAFNFRTILGTDRLSLHSFGKAIDINPVQNPYITVGRVSPEAARAYLDRDDLRRGMIVRPGPVTEAFEAFGWRWGGDFAPHKDYHHFDFEAG